MKQNKKLLHFVVISLFLTIACEHSLYSASQRAKTATTVLFGAGIAGGLAGGLGGAKWAVPGIALGGLAAGLLYRGIRKSRERRNGQLPTGQTNSNYRQRRGRNRYSYPDTATMEQGQPMTAYPAYNYVNQRKN